MLTIHFSHRFETLERLLGDRLRAQPAGGVFAADTVIVPSAAVRRRLTLALAGRDGICANVDFPYLARWLWGCIARVVPGVQAESPFDAALLVWRIHALLGDAAWAAPYPRLQRYLARADAAMRHELAQRLATLYEQYVTYRPDWLAAWSRGALVLGPGAHPAEAVADEAWQAELWRRLAPGAAAATAPAEAFVAALRARGPALVAAGALPAEVHVFALPAIAPLHLQLLQALGGCCTVQLYALNPCREYWFDCIEPRRLAYLAARGAAAAHHEVGNRLLAAWGRQAQAGLALLVDACGEAGVDDAHFDDADSADANAAPPTLLAQLQRAILEMRELEPGSITLAAGDRSVELHVCHSLARELEVLQDRLLGLFADDPTLAPGEILVVTPDLEAAAPLVDAIFGTAPPARHIPYQVTGRARSGANAAARILVELLGLAASRCAASAVFGLLQQAPVARRFGLDADALERIHGWLLDAGAHWALDAAHCASLGLPAEGRHSLADAIERLLLGHALPDDAGEPFAGMLGCGAAEGAADSAALGALWRYAEALGALRRSLAQAPLAPAEWAQRLPQALHDFFAPADDEIEDLQEVLAALRALAGQWARSGLSDALELDIVRRAVAEALDDPARGGVPGGGVTFAGMASLRSLPYRVICAIGLNDGAFPSAPRRVEFDLLQAAPAAARPGDRQRRDDERNLFLDLVVSARQVLHLSHVGRSVRDNAVLPPSVLASELLEAVTPAVGAAARSRLVVVHPLQAFSPAALRVDADPRERSFQSEYAQALRQRLAAPQALPEARDPTIEDDDADDDAADGGAEDEAARAGGSAPPFFTAPLAAPGDEWLDLPLDRLLRFFIHPGRFLLQSRLRLEVARAADELSDDEPFVASLPARSALADRLLPALLAGASRDAARALAHAGHEWPAGAVAARALESELDALEVFAGTLRPALAEPVLAPVAIELALDAAGRRWRLHGSLSDLRPGGLVRYRCDELRAADALHAWLHHLLLCAGTPPGVAPRSTWIARDRSLVLPRCEDARAQLARLLELHARGLVEPLPFHPKSAWAYMAGHQSAAKARAKWQASARHPHGEEADPAWRLALRGRPDPMGEGFAAFAECATAVYGPLLACAQDEA